MKALFHRFLLLLAQATDKELARMLQFLKVENEILRSKLPKRVPLEDKDKRRLLKFGKPLGKAIKDLITIVSPKTFLRWVNKEKPKANKVATRKPGRPKTNVNLRELILCIALETGFGFTRILGELNKLGLGKVCRTTVFNILHENGFETGPDRSERSWDDFIKRHATTLWACDFFSKKVWTMKGRIDLFVFFFIHIESRRVLVAGITAHPDRTWMVQQARNLTMFFADQRVKPGFLIRDYDSKFVPEFDEILEAEGIEVIKVGPKAPKPQISMLTPNAGSRASRSNASIILSFSAKTICETWCQLTCIITTSYVPTRTRGTYLSRESSHSPLQPRQMTSFAMSSSVDF